MFMAKRKIIKIDKEKCTGCGLCIPNCPEGAIQIIDGKAQILSDIFCDGLGACIGHCPEGAIEIEEREAEPYDEKKVMKNIVKQGINTVIAHLNHLKDHGETAYLQEALDYLKEHNIDVDFDTTPQTPCKIPQACPGSKTMDFSDEKKPQTDEEGSRASQLRQWPVQLHLVTPFASFFQGKDVVLAADCVAYALGDFHKDYLKDKSLAIACPKLDSNQDIYLSKIVSMIDEAKINTLTVMTMQVPCCGGLLYLVEEALSKASRKIPVKHIVVGIKGEILRDEWI